MVDHDEDGDDCADCADCADAYCFGVVDKIPGVVVGSKTLGVVKTLMK